MLMISPVAPCSAVAARISVILCEGRSGRRNARRRPHEVALADIEPAMTQYSVGRRHMKVEVRQGEVKGIVRAFHFHLVRAQREEDGSLGAGVDVLLFQTLYVLESRGDARLQV